MMNEDKTVLEVKNLCVAYDDTAVIDSLSFTLEQRDILVILGPNGAGKTTLLRALLKLLPYRGDIVWHAQKIGYIPPQESLRRHDLPPLKLSEFFAFKTSAPKATESMLVEVGLDPNLLPRQFDELSTGQFQRMMIAWTLLDNPDVLILDEPTSGIDIGGEETFYGLLQKFWQRQNLTILLVTHDLHVVWEYATQVLCLNRQEMCIGKPDEVLTPEQLKRLYGTGIKFYRHYHG